MHEMTNFSICETCKQWIKQTTLTIIDEIGNLQRILRETEQRCDKFAALAQRVQDISAKLDQQRSLHEKATAT